MSRIETVLVTGGAGYVGAVLVPKLLHAGYFVKVIDLFLYGDHVLDSVKDHPNLEQIRGDIRDFKLLRRIIPGCDSIIHLACISNDPSFELNPLRLLVFMESKKKEMLQKISLWSLLLTILNIKHCVKKYYCKSVQMTLTH